MEITCPQHNEDHEEHNGGGGDGDGDVDSIPNMCEWCLHDYVTRNHGTCPLSITATAATHSHSHHQCVFETSHSVRRLVHKLKVWCPNNTSKMEKLKHKKKKTKQRHHDQHDQHDY